jgi:ribose transport system substrate-binding protein
MYTRRWATGAITAVALAAAAAGCGSSSSKTGSAAGGTSSGSASSGGKHYNMTLVAGVKGDEFYITMNCGAQAAAKKLNVSLTFAGPDMFDPSQQTPVLNAVSARSPNAILIAPTDVQAMQAPIQQAAANSKIVLVDTTLKDPSVAVSQVHSNNILGGVIAGQTLLKLIGNKGKVFVMNVKPGISTTDQRQQGFEQAVKGKSGVTYVGAQYDNDDPAQAASIVSAVLQRHPDLAGIFATNLFSAEGAATALQQAGKLGKVKIVGFDAGPKQVADLQKGLTQALVAQEPAVIGADGVQQAVNALSGKPVTKVINTGYNVITKQNLPKKQSAVYKAHC